jgi:hypothetical protein
MGDELVVNQQLGLEFMKAFYLTVLLPVAYLSNWFFMTPSIATKFQYINSL